jgi:hypothetical protein
MVAAIVQHVDESLRPDGIDCEATLHAGWQPDYSLTLSQADVPADDALAVCVCPHCEAIFADRSGSRVRLAEVATAAWSPADSRPSMQEDLQRTRETGPELLARALRHATDTELRVLLFGTPQELARRGWGRRVAGAYDGVLLGLGESAGVELRAAWESAANAAGGGAACSTNWSPARAGEPFEADARFLGSVSTDVGLYNYSLIPSAGAHDFRMAAAAARGEARVA